MDYNIRSGPGCTDFLNTEYVTIPAGNAPIILEVNLDDLGLAHNVPEGAYYILLDISEFGYGSDLAFCEDLAREVGEVSVPGSSFFQEPVNHLIRFHFAKRDETLNSALNRLSDIRKKFPHHK